MRRRRSTRPPQPDVPSRVDTSTTCSVAYFGACLTRRASDGAVTECREYSLSAAYPSRDVYRSSCAASKSTLVRTWQAAACPRATSVGGCRVDSTSGPALCYSQIDWYFPPSSTAGAQAACTMGAVCGSHRDAS